MSTKSFTSVTNSISQLVNAVQNFDVGGGWQWAMPSRWGWGLSTGIPWGWGLTTGIPRKGVSA